MFKNYLFLRRLTKNEVKMDENFEENPQFLEDDEDLDDLTDALDL